MTREEFTQWKRQQVEREIADVDSAVRRAADAGDTDATVTIALAMARMWSLLKDSMEETLDGRAALAASTLPSSLTEGCEHCRQFPAHKPETDRQAFLCLHCRRIHS